MISRVNLLYIYWVLFPSSLSTNGWMLAIFPPSPQVGCRWWRGAQKHCPHSPNCLHGWDPGHQWDNHPADVSLHWEDWANWGSFFDWTLGVLLHSETTVLNWWVVSIVPTLFDNCVCGDGPFSASTMGTLHRCVHHPNPWGEETYKRGACTFSKFASLLAGHDKQWLVHNSNLFHLVLEILKAQTLLVVTGHRSS